MMYDQKFPRTQASQPVEFITKLYQMLSDSSLTPVVSWSPSQTSFLIHDVSRFQQEIIPQVFKHSNFASFVRQLNKYGFHKVKSRPNAPANLWEFEHPSFRPENSHDLTLIRRKQKSASSSAAAVKETVDNLCQQVTNLSNRIDQVERENRQLREGLHQQGAMIERLLAESNRNNQQMTEHADLNGRRATAGVMQLPVDAEDLPKSINQVALAMDDSVARDICTRLLRKFGFAVSAVANGQDLLKLIETGGPFHYVIMDLVLEGVDGLYAIHVMRTQQVSIPVVLILDEGRYHLSIDEYIRRGASAVLIRPFTKSMLYDTLQSVNAGVNM